MKVNIPNPKNFEIRNGHSVTVRNFLNEVELAIEEECESNIINILRVSLLLAPSEEIEKGAFAEYMRFDWKIGYAAVGVHGDYEKYLHGDDFEKIAVISQMLEVAFMRIASRKKSKFDSKTATNVTIKVMSKHMNPK